MLIRKCYVYKLLDYKKSIFYIGVTWNLVIRIKEHTKCKGNNSKKDYRVRKCIQYNRKLLYLFEEFDTKKEALIREKELISKFKYQLCNKIYGIHKNDKFKSRKQGRSKQCPTCLCYFKRIGSHKCKK